MTRSTRVLSVGIDSDLATESINWDRNYNVKDYDWVFFDFYSLEKSARSSSVSNILSGRYESPNPGDVFRAVATGTNFVVFLPNRTRIKYNEQSTFEVSSYLPPKFGLQEQSGESLDISSVQSEWEWYFDSNFSWNVIIAPKEDYYKYQGNSIPQRFEPIAVNAAMEPLAGKFFYTKSGEAGQGPSEALDGNIFLIPVINNWDPKDLMGEILTEFSELDYRIQSKESPKWTEDYSLPGEEQTISEMESLREEKLEIEQAIEAKQNKLKEFEQYKVLLWGNEGQLEQFVPVTFREMGFDVESEIPHGRDGLISLTSDIKMVLEITGTKQDISDEKCRQLSTWVDDADMDAKGEVNHMGLLVINPNRLVAPEERNPNEYLPTHLRDFLSKRGFRVLTTPKLYEMYSDFRRGDLDKEDVRDELLSDGLFVYE